MQNIFKKNKSSPVIQTPEQSSRSMDDRNQGSYVRKGIDHRRFNSINPQSKTLGYLPNKRGFSLAEILIYIFLLSILATAVINSLSRMSRSYRDIKVSKNIALSAESFLNRLSNEIKSATNVSGSFGTTSASLTLTSGTTTTIFSIDNSAKRILVSTNGVSDYLTISGISAENLKFYLLSATTTSRGIYTTFTLSGTGTISHSENFEATEMLRNYK